MSLSVTRHGFTIMTLKPNNSPHTGRVLLHLTPSKHYRCACEWRQYHFFYHWGIMHYEFAPEGQTVNLDFCMAVLRCLWDAVQRKWPEIWTAGSCFLRHDNVSTHTALSVRHFLAKHSIPTLPQPLCSPDPSHLFSIPKTQSYP
jgi:hypothetical protein